MDIQTILLLTVHICGSLALTNDKCSVAIQDNTTLQAYDQQCITLVCNAENDDDDPDALSWRIYFGNLTVIHYERKVYDEYRYNLNVTDNVGGVPYSNRWSLSMRANKSLIIYTCQCGVSTDTKTVNVTDKGLGNCDGTTTRVNLDGAAETFSYPSCVAPPGVVKNRATSQKISEVQVDVNRPAGCFGEPQIWGLVTGSTTVECRLASPFTQTGNTFSAKWTSKSKPSCVNGSPMDDKASYRVVYSTPKLVAAGMPLKVIARIG